MKHFIFTTFVIIYCTVLSAQHKAEDVCGKWWTQDKRGVIEIYQKDGKFYGKLIESKESLDEDGNIKKDKENPIPALRERPVIGINILFNFLYAGGNEWKEGKAYDPESGNIYSGKMTLVNKNTLELRGFIGISLIGRTETWTRKQ